MQNVKRMLLIMLLAFTAAIDIFGAEAVIIPTQAVNVIDQVTGILPARPLRIPQISQVNRGQWFEIVAGVVDPECPGGKLLLYGSLTVKFPDGKTKKIFTNAKLFVSDREVRGIVISNVQCRVCFEENDKNGRYTYELTLFDPANPGKVLKSRPVTVILTDKKNDTAPMSEAELSKFFTWYYTAPQPERLIAALEAFWKLDAARRSEKNKKYAPQIFLYGFAEAFRLNPQLWEDLPANGAKLTGEQKKLFAMLLVAIGSDAVDKLTPQLDGEVLKIIRSFKQRNPLYIAQVRYPWQLDCLWVKFMITGRKEPVKQIAAELRKRDVLTLEQAKSKRDRGEKLTPDELNKLNNFLLTMAAYWSLQSNIQQKHLLAAYYLEAMLTRKEYADNNAGVLINSILKKASQKSNKTNSAAGEKRKK